MNRFIAAVLMAVGICCTFAVPIQGGQNETTRYQAIFDGHSLNGWRITEFFDHANVIAQSNSLILEQGKFLTGVTFTNKCPTVDYEISLEAMRVEGSDFFCGLTFPIQKTNCTLIIGGWGGSLVGISSVDGLDASENQTTTSGSFTNGVWYSIRLQVSSSNIRAWVADKQVVNLPTKDHEFGTRFGEISLSCPLGFATYKTKAALRNIRLRPLP